MRASPGAPPWPSSGRDEGPVPSLPSDPSLRPLPPGLLRLAPPQRPGPRLPGRGGGGLGQLPQDGPGPLLWGRPAEHPLPHRHRGPAPARFSPGHGPPPGTPRARARPLPLLLDRAPRDLGPGGGDRVAFHLHRAGLPQHPPPRPRGPGGARGLAHLRAPHGPLPRRGGGGGLAGHALGPRHPGGGPPAHPQGAARGGRGLRGHALGPVPEGDPPPPQAQHPDGLDPAHGPRL